MISQSQRYTCDNCSIEEYSDVGNPFAWVNDKCLCESCQKETPMNLYDDYIALRDKFENDLRFIFPSGKISLCVEIDEVKIKDFNAFTDDAAEFGRVEKRQAFGCLDYSVLKLDNGDEINTVI